MQVPDGQIADIDGGRGLGVDAALAGRDGAGQHAREHRARPGLRIVQAVVAASREGLAQEAGGARTRHDGARKAFVQLHLGQRAARGGKRIKIVGECLEPGAVADEFGGAVEVLRHGVGAPEAAQAGQADKAQPGKPSAPERHSGHAPAGRAGQFRVTYSGCTPRGRRGQWDTDFENTFITTTPAMIRPMPTSAGVSRCCLNSTAPTMEISTMPTPDQMA